MTKIVYQTAKGNGKAEFAEIRKVFKTVKGGENFIDMLECHPLDSTDEIHIDLDRNDYIYAPDMKNILEGLYENHSDLKITSDSENASSIDYSDIREVFEDDYVDLLKKWLKDNA